MWPASLGSFCYGVFATLAVQVVGMALCGWCWPKAKQSDVAVEAAREAKRKGLHPELN
jgi:hypothetical protein